MGSFEERRSGLDTRTPQQPEKLVERRSGEDRRAVARRRVLKGVKIAFKGDFCSVEGTLKNVSDTGALIQLKDGYLVPDSITIFNELDGYKVEARVVRRNVNTIGVHFTSDREAIQQSRAQKISMLNDGWVSSVPDVEEEAPKSPPAPVAQPKTAPVFGKIGTIKR